jgi:hypothetical protein
MSNLALIRHHASPRTTASRRSTRRRRCSTQCRFDELYADGAVALVRELHGQWVGRPPERRAAMASAATRWLIRKRSAGSVSGVCGVHASERVVAVGNAMQPRTFEDK